MSKINSIEEIDFNELWKNAYSNSRFGKKEKNLQEFWNRRAKKYSEDIKKKNYEKGERHIKNLKINSKTTILEIGPGPGTITIPLAKKIKHITVVEPSQEMIKQLMKNANECGIDNITTINKRWEDVNIDEIEKHDIVVASFSLSMLDIKDALQKINEIADKSVYLFWFVNHPIWEEFYIKLYKKLHNRPYVPAPKSIYIYNILYQMGIYANVVVKEEDYSQSFSDFDEALSYFKDILDIENNEQVEILRNCLGENLNDLTLSGKSTIATIWWEKKISKFINNDLQH